MNQYVYICAPFRGDLTEQIKNMRDTEKHCRDLLLEEGEIPVAPQLYFPRFLNEENERERQIGLMIGLQLLEFCSKIYVYGDKITEGMSEEIKQAKLLKMPITYVNERECVN